MITSSETSNKAVPLGQVAEFIRGITFSPEDKVDAHSQGSVVCMRTANIQSELDESDLIAVPAEFVRRAEQFLKEGDLLVSTANSWNLVGKCVWVPKLAYSATAGGFISILRGDSSVIDPRYLFYWFSSEPVQHEARRCGRQTTNISNLDYARCLSLPVPLPPLAEQRRIAAILDKSESIRANRRDALSILTKQLVPAFFQELFGSVGDDRWDRVPVSNFVERFEGGRSIVTDESPSNDTRFFVLKVSAVTWGEYLPNESKPAPGPYEPPPEHLVRRGDLLFSRANTAELLGATAFVYETPDNRLLPDKLWRFIWKDRTQIEPLFVKALFDQPKVRHEMGRRATGTSGSMKNISMDKVMSLAVPLPPVSLQRRFASAVLQAYKLRTKLEIAHSHDTQLFHSLVQRAFRGGL